MFNAASADCSPESTSHFVRSSSRAPPLMSVVELTTRMSKPEAGQHELRFVLEVDGRGRTLTCVVFGCGTQYSLLWVWSSTAAFATNLYHRIYKKNRQAVALLPTFKKANIAEYSRKFPLLWTYIKIYRCMKLFSDWKVHRKKHRQLLNETYCATKVWKTVCCLCVSDWMCVDDCKTFYVCMYVRLCSYTILASTSSWCCLETYWICDNAVQYG